MRGNWATTFPASRVGFKASLGEILPSGFTQACPHPSWGASMTSTTSLPPADPFEYAHPVQFFPQALPRILSVGNGGCGHSSRYLITWSTTFCGLCFLQEGFQEELPKRLHLSKTLADNGNPQQTPKLESHMVVVEGISTPRLDENLAEWKRKRFKSGTKTASKLFPFASSLWHVSHTQPPLARVLNLSIRGYAEIDVSEELQISIFSTVERLKKGTSIAIEYIRKRHGSD